MILLAICKSVKNPKGLVFCLLGVKRKQLLQVYLRRLFKQEKIERCFLSAPCTLLQLTESGVSPTAYVQGLQRWQVCSLSHLSAVGTERPLKIGACKVCFWIKLVRLQKNLWKDYAFLPRGFWFGFFFHYLEVISMSHVNLQIENLCIPRSLLPKLLSVCCLLSLLLWGEHFQKPESFSPG